jgi:hemerythrin-like domain-containing protein
VKLTDALLGEHGAIYALFDHVEEIASTASSVGQIHGAMTALEAMVLSHATLEEELLFSALEPQMGRISGPLAVMHSEHEEMQALLERIEEAEDVGDAVQWISRTLNSARNHFKKEEQVLFPMAEDVLGDETLYRLGAEWAKARKVTLA